MSGEDVYGEAKRQMRFSERILAAIPGWRGYKEKELRRESDKLIRNHLYLKLSGTKKNLRNIFQKLSDRRLFEVLTDMDRLMAIADRTAEKVNHASYGYSGFFDIVKVREENLDRMTEFDTKLMDQVDGVSAEVEELKAEIRKNEFKTAKDRIQNIVSKFEDFESTFDKRHETILGVH